MARADRANFLASRQVFLRVARPTLTVWYRLLCVVRLLVWASSRIDFWGSFWAYLHITYKTLNKTN